MDQQALEKALFDADGRPVRVTRIEIEPLAPTPDRAGLCRWILWSEGRRIYSATAQPQDLPALLEATRLLIETNSGAPPRPAPPLPRKG